MKIESLTVHAGGRTLPTPVPYRMERIEGPSLTVQLQEGDDWKLIYSTLQTLLTHSLDRLERETLKKYGGHVHE